MKKKIMMYLMGLMLMSHPVFADDVLIDSSGNVKTGVSNTNGGNLEVTGASAEDAIMGFSSGTSAAGVYGINTTYGNFGILGYDNFGVYGYSSSSYAGYFQGNARITGNLTVDGTFTGNETDPQVGALVNGNWCTSDGTQVNCNESPPVMTENDPTVNPLGKAALSCSTGQVAKWNGSVWACADDIDTNTTYSAGTGLDIAGTTFSVEIPLTLSGSAASGGILSGTNSASNGWGVYGSAPNTGGGTNYGGYFEAANTVGNGVYGVATNSGNYTNYGGSFTANGWTGRGVQGWAQYSGAATNIGGYFQADGTTGRGVQGHASNSGSVTNYGGYFTAAGSTGGGVYGQATSTGSVTNYGGYFQADGRYGRGVYGRATNTNPAGGTNYGGYFQADGIYGMGVYGIATYGAGTATNYGGYFQANGIYGFGVYGYSTGNPGTGVYGYATGSSSDGVTGYTNGSNSTGVRGRGVAYDFYAAGPGQDYGTASSIRWKRNIVDIENALDKVLALRGVYFDWDEEHGGQHDMGFIAEEVGKIIPEVVTYEPDEVYATGIDYGAITPVLVQAIKEQQEQIKRLNDEIEELRKDLSALPR